MNDDSRQHGGARKGAGRPPLEEHERKPDRKVRCAFRLAPDALEKLRAESERTALSQAFLLERLIAEHL